MFVAEFQQVVDCRQTSSQQKGQPREREKTIRCGSGHYVGGTATCNFNTGNSNNLHRIDMSKVSYGIYIGGDVTIR